LDKKILITGASGLLGRALAKLFSDKDFVVFGQYHTQKPAGMDDCRWMQADFSTLAGIRTFLQKNSSQFKDCRYLVNNYGPITYKDTPNLKSEDFLFDFHHNVVTAVEITNFFLENTKLESVVNIGFEFAGIVKPYKKILSYAAAKNALLLITKSYAVDYAPIRFDMVCPPTLKGAIVESQKGEKISPGQAAQEIYEALLRNPN
jgi:NAD(P)-dependent dehydrogenase (short-subunit alcohol dehydrogenase family)